MIVNVIYDCYKLYESNVKDVLNNLYCININCKFNRSQRFIFHAQQWKWHGIENKAMDACHNEV